MAFDFSTLVTDRTQQDVAYAKQLIDKLVTGTATDAEKAEWNSFTLKGAYNHTDLNRVTAAMEDLKLRLEGYGYAVPGYQRIKVPHPVTGGGSRLPEGYTELAWIESSGTQYVDTGFKPDQNTRVVMDAQSVVAGAIYWGCRASSSSTDSKAFVVLGLSAGGVRSDYFGSTKSLTGVVATSRITLDQNKNAFTAGGSSATHTATTNASSLDLYLCAINQAGSATTISGKGIRIYSCQIYDNGTLVRDYIPCINPDGAVGLFDVVNEQFYGNAGTGVFVAGARVGVILPDGYTRLSHIESTGTQHIDTGYKPGSSTTLYAEVSITTLPSSGSAFILGARTASGSGRFSLYVNGSSIGFGYNTTTNIVTSVSAPTTKTSISIVGNVCTFGGVSKTATASTFTTTYNLSLFAENRMGTISENSSYKLYSCQIYDNGTLIRDYVPCINPSNEVGLYDLVTESFFGNSGTGSFVAGAIPRELPEGYTQVEYIQSSGDQWINTNYSPRSENVVYECEWIEPTLSAGTSLFGSTNTTSSANKWSGVHYHNAQGSLYSATGSSDKMCIIDGIAVGSKNSLKTTISNGTITRVQNGKTLTASYSGSIQNGVPIGLFADIRTADVVEKCPVQMFSWKMWDNGVIVRDFVPCKNNNGVHGMYDLADGVFYQNAGSGAFTAGEEVAPPVTTSVTVVPDNATEYDPYTWYEFDWPTPEAMTMYMLNVAAIRTVLSVLQSTPRVPLDMEKLMVQEANDIEQIVLDVYRQITIMPTTFIACGEALCGGDNL